MSQLLRIRPRLNNSSVRRISRKFEIGEPHVLDQNLIGANRIGRLESFRAGVGHKVILINAVAAHAEPANQRAIFVESGAAWEKHDPAVVSAWQAAAQSLRARIR